MNLWLSAEVDSEAFEGFRRNHGVIENAVNAVLQRISESTRLTKWYVIFIITQLEPPAYPEVAEISRRGTTAEFRMRIPIDRFLEANDVGKRTLMWERVLASLDKLIEATQDGALASLRNELTELKNNDVAEN